MAATAIVIAFENAAPVVGRWRTAHTADGADGMPPHVTLLYPWIDEDLLEPGDVAALRRVLGDFAAFDVSFGATARFAGSPIALFLQPHPHEPFIAMTLSIHEAFPGYPPYGGVYEEPVPHLTVVHTDDAEIVTRAERELAAELPVTGPASAVQIMRHTTDEGWTVLHTILLGQNEPPG